MYSFATFGSCPLRDIFSTTFGHHVVLPAINYSRLSVHFPNIFSMSNITVTSYTASIPKRPDLMGKPDQVFVFTNFMDHLIGGIRAETITALGTVTPGSLSLQYL
jgi:hypothetical protein